MTTIQDREAAEDQIIRDLSGIEERLTDAESDRDEPSALLRSIRRSLSLAGCRKIKRGGRSLWLPMDIWLVALKDSLQWYQFPDWLAGKVESIHEIRFFDRSSVTHLCSIEGSYWADFIDMRVTLREEYADDESLRDNAYDWVLDANRETDGDYYDERSMDRLIERATPGEVHHYGNPRIDWDNLEGDTDEEKWEEAMRSLQEHFRCNAYL